MFQRGLKSRQSMTVRYMAHAKGAESLSSSMIRSSSPIKRVSLSAASARTEFPKEDSYDQNLTLSRPASCLPLWTVSTGLAVFRSNP